ncbi:MAG: hypothetical protein ACLU99_01725 [Alphaproteobacteria bacterium]
MAEENNSEEEVKEATPDTGAASSGSGGVQLSRRETEQRASITDLYFLERQQAALTLPGSSLVVNDDTRRLLALFSDGRFLVVETHKFDGRVLSFEVLARKNG